MKLSYNWLKDYINLKGISPEELAKRLTMSGSEVGEVESRNGDSIMELEITTNRPDCLNIVGLAREASAVFDRDLNLPDMMLQEEASSDEGRSVECVIKDPGLCPRYTARIITDINVAQAGKLISERIRSIGLRPVNNIVDITNFCLMELGQPLHAFDLDKIKGEKIIVRKARKGEKIITIDEIERELTGDMLVIADEIRPIAIAGVMGGKDTEVTEKTKNILLESAYFDPLSVRRTGRDLGLSSDSSYRFERGVDKGLIEAASRRATSIIIKEAGGKTGIFCETGTLDAGKTEIEFNVRKSGEILGIELKTKDAKRILSRLGMDLSEETGESFTVGVPTFREDLKNAIDLTEEVARVYGYENIPATISRSIAQVKRKEPIRLVMEKLRDVFSALGLNEIMTYSLISGKAAERFSSISRDIVQLANPLSEDHKVLTPQLLGGMMKSLAWNINRKNKDLSLFEVGKIYSRGKKEFIEIPALSAGMSGLKQKNWSEEEKVFGLYDLKGTIQTALSRLSLRPEFKRTDIEGFSSCCEIRICREKEAIGFLAEAGPVLLKEYDIEQPVFLCQIKLDKVIEHADLNDHYHSIPRFPFSGRDMSILCDEKLEAAKIHDSVMTTGEEIVRSLELLDIYEGKQVPQGKKSLTYRVNYGLDTRTLTEEEIESVHSKIKDTLTKKLNVTFR